MPEVGLFTATEPLPKQARVVIRYTVEVDGLAVYTETYDVEKIAAELAKDAPTAVRLWARRIQCPVGCRNHPGFSSCLTRCLADGECCELGHESCKSCESTD